MKVLITRTCAAQGQHLEEGQVFDLDTKVAEALRRMGKATDAPVQKAKPRKPKAAVSNAPD